MRNTVPASEHAAVIAIRSRVRRVLLVAAALLAIAAVLFPVWVRLDPRPHNSLRFDSSVQALMEVYGRVAAYRESHSGNNPEDLSVLAGANGVRRENDAPRLAPAGSGYFYDPHAHPDAPLVGKCVWLGSRCYVLWVTRRGELRAARARLGREFSCGSAP